MRRSLSSLRAAAIVVALAASAHAQNVSPADHERAVTNFEAGRRMVEQGRCAEAIPRFIESIRAEPSVGARFNLAECSAKQNRLVDAWNQYKVAEQLAITKKDTERMGLARRAAAELEAKVVKVRLSLPENVAVTVHIDAHVIPETDYELLGTGYAVEPGVPHTIEVSAPNYGTWRRENVHGAAGIELTALPVDLGPPLVAPGQKQRTLGIVVGAVGLAGLVVGSVFGLVAISNASAIRADCPKDPSGTFVCPGTDASHDAKYNWDKTPPTLSTIGFIAGGVLVAAGAVIYFTAPTTVRATSAARLHLAPLAGPGTAGVLLGGSF